MTTDGAVDQAELVLRGMASAVRHDGELTDTQTSLLTAIGKYLFGVEASPAELEPLDPGDLADAVTDPTLRRRAVHGMVTLEIVMDPVPPAVADQVERYASALQVDDAMLTVARDYSEQAMDQAMQDYARNSYPARVLHRPRHRPAGHRNDLGDRRRTRRQVERARVVPRRVARPDGLGLLPAARLRAPRYAGWPYPPCSRSTTGCTASPTTARRPPARSRCSASSRRRSPTRRASRTRS